MTQVAPHWTVPQRRLGLRFFSASCSQPVIPLDLPIGLQAFQLIFHPLVGQPYRPVHGLSCFSKAAGPVGEVQRSSFLYAKPPLGPWVGNLPPEVAQQQVLAFV